MRCPTLTILLLLQLWQGWYLEVLLCTSVQVNHVKQASWQLHEVTKAKYSFQANLNSLSHLSCLHNFNSSLFPFYVTIFVRTHQLVVMSQVGGRSILLYNFKLQRNRPWKHFQTSGWLQLPAGYCGEKAPWIWPIGWILRVFLGDEQIKKIMKKKCCTKSIFRPVWKWLHSILFWDELFFSTKPPAETRFTHKPASSW